MWTVLKVVRLLKRRPDLTREEFKDYWLREHSKLEAKVMESGYMRKIVASFPTGEMIGGQEPPFDGMVELYFDTKEDMEALFASDIPKMMREDEKNFVDLSGEVLRVVTEEHIMGQR